MMDMFARAVLAGLLLIIVLGFTSTWLLGLFRKRPARKAIDPAADARACPYGERPGFSREELDDFSIHHQRRDGR